MKFDLKAPCGPVHGRPRRFVLQELHEDGTLTTRIDSDSESTKTINKYNMNDEELRGQIEALRNATKKACKSKASAIKYLEDAGIETTPERIVMPAENINTSYLWHLVKMMEEKTDESSRELGEITATLIVNFSEDNKGRHPVLIDKTDRPFVMLLKVLEYYTLKHNGTH